MKRMPWLFLLAVAALSATVFAGDAPARASSRTSVWAGHGGIEEERQAEQLELRDELISAQMSYLSALEKALIRIGSSSRPDSAGNLLAWARVEYLLETSFRLLSDTGEYEMFLKATDSIKPVRVDPIPAPPLTDTALGAIDGGLMFETDAGQRLRVVEAGEGVGLVRVDNGEEFPITGNFAARPHADEPQRGGAAVNLILARAAWLRAQVFERLGRVEEAARETRGLGVIRDWLVLGPLDWETENFADIDFSLDYVYANFAHPRTYSGKDGPVSWRSLSTRDPLGRLTPGALFRTPGSKSAIALSLVYSPIDRAAVMRFGSDSPATVCVNHISQRRTWFSGSPDPDQEAFNVWLRKGWNIVMIKTTSSSDEGWGLAARLTALDGTPLPCRVAEATPEAVAGILARVGDVSRRTVLDSRYLPARLAEVGGVSILSDFILDNPDDARAHFYLASFLADRRMMEGPDRFDQELIFRQAVDLSGHNPFYTLMAARAVEAGVDGIEREENLRLVLLRSVADQGSAAALTDIGRLYLDVMRQPRRADSFAEQALKVNPMSLRAGVLDYDVAVTMEWRAVAETLLKRLVQRHPTAAAVRLRLGRAALAEGRYRQALTEFHALLGMDAENHEALDGAVRALGMLGQTSAAAELLLRQIDRFPYDLRNRRKLATLYRVLGRDDDAMAAVDAMLEMAPDDPEALEVRREIARESYAEGADSAPAHPAIRQELDLSPPRRQVPNGWEYLYFQTEDRMDRAGAIRRTVSFAIRIYSDRAAAQLRHLGFMLEREFESGSIASLHLIRPSGEREELSPAPQPAGAGRALRFNLPPLRIGMIVEASVEIQRARIPFLGDYFGQIAPLTQPAPVRLSRYMFTRPADRKMYFLPVNGAPEALEVPSADGREITHIWEMSNLPAFTPEPGSPGQNQLMPCIQISSFRNWDEFSRWYWRLFGGQYHTPPELRRLARYVAGEASAPMDKLDLAAAWISRNLAHREWEYGPYAFRPINARTVLSRLAADGKDRALLLTLLAREYDLAAWPVLARMRDDKYAPIGSENLSLPLLEHFNHSLVRVDTGLGGDVYLDASNPYRPPGVMPSQLFGSPGVAVGPESGRVVVIPDGGVSACVWEDTATMVVDEDGSVLWEQKVRGTGTAAETLRMRFRREEGRDDVWMRFLTSLGATPSTAAAQFDELPQAPAEAEFSGRARLRRLAMMNDNRAVLTVPPFPGALAPGGDFAYPLSFRDYARYGLREQDLLLPHGFRLARSLRISYPSEWRLANPPESFVEERGFGRVELRVSSSPGAMTLEFEATLPGHRIRAGDYDDFRLLTARMQRWLRPLLIWEMP